MHVSQELFFWVIGIVVAVFGGINGAIYLRTIHNSRRIGFLEVGVSRLEAIPHELERHEDREEKIFNEIRYALDSIKSDVGLMRTDVEIIKRYANGKKV